MSAGSHYQLELVRDSVDELEGHVRSQVLADLVDRLALDQHAEQPNVVLRVVGDEFWPFDLDEEVAPAPVVAVDLLEAGPNPTSATRLLANL